MHGLLLFALCCNLTPASAADIQPAFAMDSDPALQAPPPNVSYDLNLLPLWQQALKRPEAEYQRQAALAIITAHGKGFPGLDIFPTDLVRILTAADAHPLTVLAAATALVELNARQAAEPLWETAQRRGADLRQVVEPALAEWDYAPARTAWRARLADNRPRRRDLLLAVDGSAKVRDPLALPLLVAMTRSSERPADVRLAAARAAGAIATEGLEADAAALSAGSAPSVLSRLCAVGLLTRHTSDAARQQLLVSARDAEPTVAAASLQILLSIDPALVLPLVAEVLQNRDANVRMCGVEAYVALPTVDRVAVLATVLDDVHTGVRGRVREALIELAQRPDLDATVRGTAQDQLAGSSWRGQEQAALLLAALDHKPAASRLIELLESERSEVMEVSAWALRILALPETGPALLDKADRQTTARLAEDAPLRALDRQVAHLFEALGRIDHTPAIPLMLRYVPKAASYGEMSRAAAIWSLGLLHRERPNPELAQQLFGRANDNGSMPPESEIVKRLSVVSLGWMRAQPHVEGLRKMMGPVAGTEPFSLSVRWSIMQITGEELPLPRPPEVLVDGGFLAPVK